MDINKLDDLFEEDEIEWRISRSGKKKNGDIWATGLAYVTARAIQNRLDDVCGKMFWQNEFREWKGDAQLCGISIYNKDLNIWVTKYDGSENTSFSGTKGGLSGSEKRAGCQWGIGRYLYKLPETFVETSLTKVPGWNFQSPGKETPSFYWNNPDLPSWAVKTNKEIEKPVVDPVKETWSKIKSIAGPSMNDLEEFLKVKYVDSLPLKNIWKTHLKEILSELERLGIEKYLQDLPF